MCQANNTFSVLSVTNNTLKVYHQNICGLKCRTNEKESFLYPDLPHTLCLIKQHLNQLELDNTYIDNYNFGAKYGMKSFKKGGVCIFVN